MEKEGGRERERERVREEREGGREDRYINAVKDRQLLKGSG